MLQDTFKRHHKINGNASQSQGDNFFQANVKVRRLSGHTIGKEHNDYYFVG